MHTKTPRVTIQGNISAIRYRNDVIRSILLHIIRANSNLGMMLARDYASCHTARSTLVMFVANNVQKLKMQKVWMGAHACYSSDECGHSTTVYS